MSRGGARRSSSVLRCRPASIWARNYAARRRRATRSVGSCSTKPHGTCRDSSEGRLLRRGGVRAGFGDLSVLRSSPAGSSDGPDDFAVDNNWEAALDRGRSTKTERAHADAALRYQIFENFARPAEIERRLRLVLSNADRTVLCVVEPVQHYRMAGTVENDYRHRPIVLHSLCLGGGHNLLGRIESDRRAVRDRGRRRGCSGLLSAAGKGIADEECCRNNERAEPVHGVSSSGWICPPRADQKNRVEIRPAFSQTA